MARTTVHTLYSIKSVAMKNIDPCTSIQNMYFPRKSQSNRFLTDSKPGKYKYSQSVSIKLSWAFLSCLSSRRGLLTKLSDHRVETWLCGHVYQTSSQTVVREHQEHLLTNVANILQLSIIKVLQNKCGNCCNNSWNKISMFRQHIYMLCIY